MLIDCYLIAANSGVASISSAIDVFGARSQRRFAVPDADLARLYERWATVRDTAPARVRGPFVANAGRDVVSQFGSLHRSVWFAPYSTLYVTMSRSMIA